MPNKEDEEVLRLFHAEEKKRRIVLECIRFYLFVPNAAACLAALAVITKDNGKFTIEGREDLRFCVIEQVYKGVSDRWAIRVMRRSDNSAVDADVHEGREYFQALTKELKGTYEGCMPCYAEIVEPCGVPN